MIYAKTTACLAALMLTASLAATQAEEVQTCAILTFDTDTAMHGGLAGLMANKMTVVLTRRSSYKAYPRLRVNRWLAANAFRPEAYPSHAEAAIAAGQIINTDFVIYGRLFQNAEGFTLDAMLVDIHAEHVAKRASVSVPGTWNNFIAEAPETVLRALVELKQPKKVLQPKPVVVPPVKKPPVALKPIPRRPAPPPKIVEPVTPPKKVVTTVAPVPVPKPRPKKKVIRPVLPPPVVLAPKEPKPIAKIPKKPRRPKARPPVKMQAGEREPFWNRFSVGYETASRTWTVHEYDNTWDSSFTDPTSTEWAGRDADISGRFMTIRYAMTPDAGVTLRYGKMKGGDNDVNLFPGSGKYKYRTAFGVGVDARLATIEALNMDILGLFEASRGESSIWWRGYTRFSGTIEEWRLDVMARSTYSIPYAELFIHAGLRYEQVLLLYIHENYYPLHYREGGFESEDEFGFVFGGGCTIMSHLKLLLEAETGAATGTRMSVAYEF